MNIVFDATRLKYPNTGLYHFTLELGCALQRISLQEGVHIEFLERGDHPILPFGSRKVTAIDKLIARNPSGAKLWHSPYQFYRYKVPSNVVQVLTVHDLNFLREKNAVKQSKYLKKLQQQVDRADAVVAISQFTARDIADHIDMKGKQIEVIYNGCNIPQVDPAQPQYVPPAPFVYGIGTMLPKKNWHTLPSMIVDTPYHLVLSGGQTPYCEQIIEQAKIFGVADRVHLTGAVSEAQKQWYLSQCAAFAFPSLAEGFGLPVVEAMYYGKPLFLSPHCSLPEIAGEKAYYFDQDFDPHSMRQTLIEGMADFDAAVNPSLLREKSLSYSWDSAARKYIEIYQRIAK